jgi:hypothetical protein
VQITRQKRNANQSAGEIEFTFHPFRPKIAESAGPTLSPVGVKTARINSL